MTEIRLILKERRNTNNYCHLIMDTCYTWHVYNVYKMYLSIGNQGIKTLRLHKNMSITIFVSNTIFTVQ